MKGAMPDGLDLPGWTWGIACHVVMPGIGLVGLA